MSPADQFTVDGASDGTADTVRADGLNVSSLRPYYLGEKTWPAAMIA
jgi:hypothetical protein